jgi:lysophospholipase L1-like esterase
MLTETSRITNRLPKMPPIPSRRSPIPRFHRWLIVIASIFVTIVGMEVVGQLGYRVSKGEWLCLEAPLRTSDFMEAHPWLVAAPKPNMEGYIQGLDQKTLHIAHNSYGTRGPEIAVKKAPGITRIVTMGGSSTYCTGVSNNEAWPFRLQEMLGPRYEVINLGVMGYTTAEHLIQTTLMISDLEPDIAIYYEGWNDARNAHVQLHKPDYADFHGRSEYFNHGLYEFSFGHRSVLMLAAKKGMRAVKNPYNYTSPEGTPQQLTPTPDPRALSIYQRNLRLLGAACRELKVRPIFVPQIMNYEILDNTTPYSWLPFVRDKDLESIISFYNNTMESTAQAEGIDFVRSAFQLNLTKEDFIPKDPGHFNPEGNRKFAECLAKYIQANTIRKK